MQQAIQQAILKSKYDKQPVVNTTTADAYTACTTTKSLPRLLPTTIAGKTTAGTPTSTTQPLVQSMLVLLGQPQQLLSITTACNYHN